jgi:hypothetical protein
MMHTLRRLALGLIVAVAVPTHSWAEQANGSADGLQITPQKGQSANQQGQDRYECHRWAVDQTGFDPTQPQGGVTADRVATGRGDYQRAMTACLEARGYLVHVVPAYNPAPYPSPPAYGPVPYGAPGHYVRPPAPTLTTRPVTGIVSGGLGIPTGNTSDALGVGARFGLGMTWFPSPTVPLGLRLEGSYSWYGAHNHSYYSYYYDRSYTDLYGADIDLELNLTHQRDSRLYLVGGYGEYRATAYRTQYADLTCGYYYCSPGYVATTASATTDWHGAWNIGPGWEFAVAPGSAVYFEARYMQLVPSDVHLQFVTLTAGYRF